MADRGDEMLKMEKLHEKGNDKPFYHEVKQTALIEAGKT